MRIPNNKSSELKAKARTLFRDGFSNKEIAKKLNVTEKTISNWLKFYKSQEDLVKENEKLLLERINKLLKNEKSTSEEIKNLIYSLTQMKNYFKSKS